MDTNEEWPSEIDEAAEEAKQHKEEMSGSYMDIPLDYSLSRPDAFRDIN